MINTITDMAYSLKNKNSQDKLEKFDKTTQRD